MFANFLCILSEPELRAKYTKRLQALKFKARFNLSSKVWSCCDPFFFNRRMKFSLIWVKKNENNDINSFFSSRATRKQKTTQFLTFTRPSLCLTAFTLLAAVWLSGTQNLRRAWFFSTKKTAEIVAKLRTGLWKAACTCLIPMKFKKSRHKYD